MGHISHEPSMEEILSSIKRIIAEDGEAPQGGRGRRAADRRSAPRHDEDDPQVAAAPPADEPEILELTDEFTDPPTEEAGPEPVLAEADEAPEPQPEPEPAPVEADEMIDEDLVSTTTAKASRQALASLSKMLVKPENPAGDNTLEGLVRDMLRPMLKDWLDANLPDVVEKMVAKEIAKISGKGL